jgi:hypothetical protein
VCQKFFREDKLSVANHQFSQLEDMRDLERVTAQDQRDGVASAAAAQPLSSLPFQSSFKTRAVFAIASGDTRSSAKPCSATNARIKQPQLAEQSRRQLGLRRRRHGVGQTYGL